jgi:hypothetical protein
VISVAKIGYVRRSELKESEKLPHNSLGLVLGDIVATGVDLYDTHV